MQTSESIENISKSIVEFQAAVQNPKNTAVNPFHKNKYAPLDVVINAVRPILAEFGLAVLQDVNGQEDGVSIKTRILHESGEWMESDPLFVEVEDKKGTSGPQATGIAITYGRRYQLSAFLNISSEDDNDGNTKTSTQSKSQQKKASTKNTNGKVTEAQLGKLYATAGEKNIEKDTIKKKMADEYNVDSSKKLSKSQASQLIEWLESK